MNFKLFSGLILVLGYTVKSLCMDGNTSFPNESNVNNRITGGSLRTHSDVPFLVSISMNNKHICGGSIVSNLHIITAAHCIYGKRPNDFRIRFSSSNYDRGGGLRKVKKIFLHPKFRNGQTNSDSDVSILLLSSSINLDSEQIDPVKLPKKDSPLPSNKDVLVAGWGSLKENGPPSPQIVRVSLPILGGKSACIKYYQAQYVTDNMFCAGYPAGQTDTCKGDNGGPGTVDYTLIGIISWGQGCGRPNRPRVFVHVAKFIDFINEKLRIKT